MIPTKDSLTKKGLYLGTEIDEKWWKRYIHNKFFMRGNGKYWVDQTSFYFLRYLTKDPMIIPFNKITGLKEGKWHSGKWVGNLLVLKILWVENGVKLSSGFVITRNSIKFHQILDELRNNILNLQS
jgi:hypothetical protein